MVVVVPGAVSNTGWQEHTVIWQQKRPNNIRPKVKLTWSYYENKIGRRHPRNDVFILTSSLGLLHSRSEFIRLNEKGFIGMQLATWHSVTVGTISHFGTITVLRHSDSPPFDAILTNNTTVKALRCLLLHKGDTVQTPCTNRSSGRHCWVRDGCW